MGFDSPGRTYEWVWHGRALQVPCLSYSGTLGGCALFVVLSLSRAKQFIGFRVSQRKVEVNAHGVPGTSTEE